ncbi:8-oxo-dGTP diphosphatase MutT [Porticoccaceae bacterium]|nr:8-oxo-dGTP diphosphatase MutT [Porticoccaceae bacterium]
MKRIQVVAAVIYGPDRKDKILISKRPDHLHQGGLWEFPGGKVDEGETPLLGLVRELREELDIEITVAEPFMQVCHDYSDKQIMLDIWQVNGFEGEPRGMEGQECRWVALADLLVADSDYQFPAANKPILDKLRLILA